MLFLPPIGSRIRCPYKAEPLDLYRFEYLDSTIMGGNFTYVVLKRRHKTYSFPPGIRSGDTYIQLKMAQRLFGDW